MKERILRSEGHIREVTHPHILAAEWDAAAEWFKDQNDSLINRCWRCVVRKLPRTKQPPDISELKSGFYQMKIISYGST